MTGWLFLAAPYYVLRHCARWLLWRRTAKVTLIYKSGVKVRVRCQSCKTKRDGGSVTSIEFDNPFPNGLVYGVDEIAAVYSN